MPEVKLWEIFASLGVPGLALGVFYMLYKKFDWDFPTVPESWVGPIIVLFMLLTSAIILTALTLVNTPSVTGGGLVNELGKIAGFQDKSYECAGIMANVGVKEQSKLRCLKEKEYFSDCDICPTMIVLPPGEFMMGSKKRASIDPIPTPDDYNISVETVEHRVSINYYFAVTQNEITYTQWDICAESNGCSQYKPNPSVGIEDRKKFPVAKISWDHAQQYVRWLSDKTGKRYRLLSEAEWEYASGAKNGDQFSFGSNHTLLCAHGNGLDITAANDLREDGRGGLSNTCTDGFGLEPSPVGHFKNPNIFNLNDMHGNVAEWVADCWSENYSNRSPDHKGGKAWIEDGECDERVVRGGSWKDAPGFLRSRSRQHRLRKIDHYETVGFRVARDFNSTRLSSFPLYNFE